MEEIELKTDELPLYAMVEMSQLIKLLQRCFNCGALPGGKKTGQPRTITWTKTGTNLTATIRCQCTNQARSTWSSQSCVPNTNMRIGNISLVAAAMVAPVPFIELESLFKAAGIACLGKNSFLQISKSFVYPAIEDRYYRQKMDIQSTITEPIEMSLDDAYDSPGFSAEYCAVTAVENEKHQVLDFAIVHKSEVNNVSNNMELQGVKKLLSKIPLQVGSITVDKNPQVNAYLKKENVHFNFDLWHIVKSVKKQMRTSLIRIKDHQEKENLKELCRRFINHIYTSIEKADGDTAYAKELIFSFFCHVLGIHEWPSGKMSAVLTISPTMKIGLKLKDENFQRVTRCEHAPDAPRHDPVESQSESYQALLELATKTTFISDLERLKYGNMTSFVESFNNVCLIYRPKRKYYPLKGFEIRTMLAAIHYNENRYAEETGQRTAQYVCEYNSKAKGGKKTKTKMGPVADGWKKEIVADAIERKRRHGPGYPEEVRDEEMEEEGADLPIDYLGEMLYFESEHEDFEEKN